MSEAVSVIVPTFNRAHLIGASLDALLGQTRPPDEILVADDGSSDGTSDVVAKYGGKVSYFHKPNSGKADTLNVTLDRIKYPWVWIMDDDDLAMPDALERLLGLLASKPDAMFSYGRYERFTEDPNTGVQTRGPTGYWRTVDDDAFFITTLEDFYVHQAGLLVHRDAYAQAGPFDPERTFSEDYDMLVRLARVGPCVGTDEVVFLQRQHDGARGAANARVTVDERMAKWVEHDQQIFLKVYERLDLSDYLPRGHLMQNDADRRRAHLQRACVMARKKLWNHALQDFKVAAQMTGGPFDDVEKLIIRRSLAGKYGCAELLSDPQLRAQIQALKAVGPSGPAIRSLLSRGLMWRIREAAGEGQIARASQFAGLAARLAAP